MATKNRKPVQKKLPKKPKKTASVETKENYLKRVAEIKKEYTKALAKWNSDKKKSAVLDKKISGI